MHLLLKTFFLYFATSLIVLFIIIFRAWADGRCFGMFPYFPPSLLWAFDDLNSLSRRWPAELTLGTISLSFTHVAVFGQNLPLFVILEFDSSTAPLRRRILISLVAGKVEDFGHGELRWLETPQVLNRELLDGLQFGTQRHLRYSLETPCVPTLIKLGLLVKYQQIRTETEGYKHLNNLWNSYLFSNLPGLNFVKVAFRSNIVKR